MLLSPVPPSIQSLNDLWAIHATPVVQKPHKAGNKLWEAIKEVSCHHPYHDSLHLSVLKSKGGLPPTRVCMQSA